MTMNIEEKVPKLHRCYPPLALGSPSPRLHFRYLQSSTTETMQQRIFLDMGDADNNPTPFQPITVRSRVPAFLLKS